MAKVKITDNSGVQVAQFDANSDESVGAQAQNNGAAIPFACGVGACRTCVGRVKKGNEFLDKEAIGSQHISTEEDEVLTCICGVKKDTPETAEVEIECENL